VAAGLQPARHIHSGYRRPASDQAEDDTRSCTALDGLCSLLRFAVAQDRFDTLRIRLRQAQALNDVQPDAAQTENDGLGADFHLGGVDDGTDAGGHAAADIADLVEGRVLADLRHGDLWIGVPSGSEKREVPSGIRP